MNSRYASTSPRACLHAMVLAAVLAASALFGRAYAQAPDTQTSGTRDHSVHGSGETLFTGGDPLSLTLVNGLYAKGKWQEIVRRYESHELREVHQAELLLLIAKSLQHLQRIDEAAALYDLVNQAAPPDAGSPGHLAAQRARSTALLNLASLRLAQARSALRLFAEQRIPHEAINRVESGANELELQLRRTKAGVPAQFQANAQPAIQPAIQRAPQPQSSSGQQLRHSANPDRSEPVDSAVVVEYRHGRPGKDGR